MVQLLCKDTWNEDLLSHSTNQTGSFPGCCRRPTDETSKHMA